MSFAHALLAAPPEHIQGGPAPKLPDLLGIPNAELLARLRAGDETAFDAIYRAFFSRLVAVARAYVTLETAQELTQDVFVALWDRRAEWSPESEIGVYLYAAIRNRAISAIRHDRVVGRIEQSALDSGDTPGMGDPEISPDKRLERADLHVAIERFLAQLPEGMRTAFTLRWIHELSYSEVAKIMGVSEAAARKQVSRARDAILPILKHFANE